MYGSKLTPSVSDRTSYPGVEAAVRSCRMIVIATWIVAGSERPSAGLLDGTAGGLWASEIDTRLRVGGIDGRGRALRQRTLLGDRGGGRGSGRLDGGDLLLRLRGGGEGLGGWGAALGLQSFERLLVESGLDCLGRVGLVGDLIRWLVGQLLCDVRRQIEVGEFLFALPDAVSRVDQPGLMEENLRAVEEEPADGDVDEERDVDGFPEARA